VQSEREEGMKERTKKKLHQRIKKNSNGISYRHLNFYTQHSVSVIHEDDEKKRYIFVCTLILCWHDHQETSHIALIIIKNVVKNFSAGGKFFFAYSLV